MKSAKKNVPDQEQIDHWLKVSRDSFARWNRIGRTDFIQTEEYPHKLYFLGMRWITPVSVASNF